MEYIVDFDGAAAVRRIGHKEKNAHLVASDYLWNPHVRRMIQELIEERIRRTEITADRVVLALWELITADPGDLYDQDGRPRNIQEVPLGTRRAIASMDVEEVFAGKGDARELVGQLRRVRFWSKPELLKLLAQCVGLHDPMRVQINNQVDNRTVNVGTSVDLSDFSTDELKVLLKLGLKAPYDNIDVDPSIFDLDEYQLDEHQADTTCPGSGDGAGT